MIFHHAVRFEDAHHAQQVCRHIQAYFFSRRLAASIPVYMLSSQEGHVVVVIGVPKDDVVLYHDALERLMGDETFLLPPALVEQLNVHFHTGKGVLDGWRPIAAQPASRVGP